MFTVSLKISAGSPSLLLLSVFAERHMTGMVARLLSKKKSARNAAIYKNSFGFLMSCRHFFGRSSVLVEIFSRFGVKTFYWHDRKWSSASKKMSYFIIFCNETGG